MFVSIVGSFNISSPYHSGSQEMVTIQTENQLRRILAPERTSTYITTTVIPPNIKHRINGPKYIKYMSIPYQTMMLDFEGFWVCIILGASGSIYQ